MPKTDEDFDDEYDLNIRNQHKISDVNFSFLRRVSLSISQKHFATLKIVLRVIFRILT